MACPNPQNPVSPRTCTKNGLPKPSEPRFAKDVYKKWAAQTLRTPFRQGFAPDCCAPKNAGPAMAICVWKIGKSKLLRPLVLGPRFGCHTAHFRIKLATNNRFRQYLRRKEKRSNPVSLRTYAKSGLPKPSEPRFAKDMCKKCIALGPRTPFRQGRGQKHIMPKP